MQSATISSAEIYSGERRASVSVTASIIFVLAISICMVQVQASPPEGNKKIRAIAALETIFVFRNCIAMTSAEECSKIHDVVINGAPNSHINAAKQEIYIGCQYDFTKPVTGDIVDIASRATDISCPDSKAVFITAILRDRSSSDAPARGYRTIIMARADLSAKWRRLSEIRSLGVIHRSGWILHSRPRIWCIQTPEGYALFDFTDEGIKLEGLPDKRHVCGDVDLSRVGDLFRDN